MQSKLICVVSLFLVGSASLAAAWAPCPPPQLLAKRSHETESAPPKYQFKEAIQYLVNQGDVWSRAAEYFKHEDSKKPEKVCTFSLRRRSR